MGDVRTMRTRPGAQPRHHAGRPHAGAKRNRETSGGHAEFTAVHDLVGNALPVHAGEPIQIVGQPIYLSS